MIHEFKPSSTDPRVCGCDHCTRAHAELAKQKLHVWEWRRGCVVCTGCGVSRSWARLRHEENNPCPVTGWEEYVRAVVIGAIVALCGYALGKGFGWWA